MAKLGIMILAILGGLLLFIFLASGNLILVGAVAVIIAVILGLIFWFTRIGLFGLLTLPFMLIGGILIIPVLSEDLLGFLGL